MTNIKLQEITSDDEFESLRVEWSALYERSPSATPFQSPEWLLPWWKCLGRGALWVHTLWATGRLVGLAPLFIHRTGDGLRRLSLIGSGISDYLDFLLEPEFALSGVKLILEHLVSNRSSWDYCSFEALPAASALLVPQDISGVWFKKVVTDVCPVLKLPQRIEGLIAGIPPGHRRSIIRAQKAFEENRDFNIQSASKENLPDHLHAFFRLHRTRWKGRNLPGMLAEQRLQDFHCEVSGGMLKRGWLRLYGLHYGEEIIAALYSFAGKNRIYSYLSGFDPAFSKLSPGTVMICYAIHEAVKEGMQEFDFLRGEETYKYHWGARDRLTCRLEIQPAG